MPAEGTARYVRLDVAIYANTGPGLDPDALAALVEQAIAAALAPLAPEATIDDVLVTEHAGGHCANCGNHED